MDDTRPLARFQQVAMVIRDKISDGSYPVGSRLPSIAALGAELGVSHMTVRQALATLADEGVIASRRGVPAEVIAVPVQDDEPLSVAERLARVESALGLLDERVSAIEDHGSHPTRDAAPQP
jgi:DNA-binding GntR family transcriptional regulator